MPEPSGSAQPLGWDPMDRLHAEFEELLAIAGTERAPDWIDLLSKVDAHLRVHFAEEDRWMAETDFPARQCHMDEHAAVLATSGEVLQRALRGDMEHARPFIAELTRWFPAHADYLDSALAAWLCKRQFGGKPVILHRPR
jgi:hemerythrin-like metal-binding protein